MASAALSRRVGKVVVYPPPSEMSDLKRRMFLRRHSMLTPSRPARGMAGGDH
jgi:hypothetical protein